MRGFMVTCAVLLGTAALAPGQEIDRTRGKPRGLWSGDATLVGTLIDRGIAIAREKDPLKKAGHFEKVAGALAEAAERDAGKGRNARAARLADQYSRVAERGVFGNVAKAQEKGGKGFENAIQVHMERMGRHEEVLRRVLAKAPEAARKGLLRALEVSKRGRLRAMERLQANLAKKLQKREGKGKGKGEEVGKGEGPGKGGRGGPPEGKGKPDHAGKGKGKGKPDDAGPGRGKGDRGGPPPGKGKPDHAGKGKGKGKSGGAGGGGRGRGKRK